MKKLILATILAATSLTSVAATDSKGLSFSHVVDPTCSIVIENSTGSIEFNDSEVREDTMAWVKVRSNVSSHLVTVNMSEGTASSSLQGMPFDYKFSGSSQDIGNGVYVDAGEDLQVPINQYTGETSLWVAASVKADSASLGSGTHTITSTITANCN
jgi:type 1 fimbria pilin